MVVVVGYGGGIDCWGAVCLVLVVVLCGGEPTNITQQFSVFCFHINRTLVYLFLVAVPRFALGLLVCLKVSG